MDESPAEVPFRRVSIEGDSVRGRVLTYAPTVLTMRSFFLTRLVIFLAVRNVFASDQS